MQQELFHKGENMLNILFNLCDTKSLASIYTDCNDTDKFHFGKVFAVSEKEIAIQMISPDGEEDGITVMDVEKVIRVEINGQYSAKMEKLCAERTISDYLIKFENNNILKSVLSYAISNKQIVSLELMDSGYNDIVGFAESVTDDEYCIHQIDEYGFEDGLSYISINDVTMIRLLSQDEKRIMRLWQFNK